jgi:2-polyprenyl-3-methyl-5-hydroxy-6-metoxy-1,4-benzoquinol methylase
MFKKPEEYELRKQFKKRKKEIQSLFELPEMVSDRSKDKFLDYGGGTGVVFKVVSDLGLDAYYYDLDNEAKSFTMDKFGLTASKVIENCKASGIRFNYIFSDNVIEHAMDPFEFVKDLIEHLEIDGVLVIKTPHAGNTELLFNPVITIKGYLLKGLKYNSFGKTLVAWFNRYWSCDPPRHLYSFSKNSLNYLMKKFDNAGNAGLEYQILYYHTPWFNNTITEQFFSKDKRLHILKSILIRIVIFPIVPLEIILQVCKHAFLKIGILSPGGIILRIKKQTVN